MSASANKILFFLKQHGSAPLDDIADALAMTSMGARGHLQKLEQQQLLEFHDVSSGRGRPKRHWQLSAAGHQQFGDRHQDLSLQLLDAIDSLYGADGMQQLITHRTEQQRQLYQSLLNAQLTFSERLQALAQQRKQEGYMARVEQADGHWWLIEDHCPVCAAAERCQGLCQQELSLFQSLFPDAEISREEHLLKNGSRCSYRFVVN